MRPVVVAGELGHEAAGDGVPEADEVVVAGGGRQLNVRGEAKGGGPPSVAEAGGARTADGRGTRHWPLGACATAVRGLSSPTSNYPARIAEEVIRGEVGCRGGGL